MSKILPPWIAAIVAAGAFIVSISNSLKISEVHVLVNSRLSELLTLTKAASRAEGVKEESDRNARDSVSKIPH